MRLNYCALFCRLNVFGEDSFSDLINADGRAVSIAEGRHLFGDIGVTSSDSNLRVAVDNCHISTSASPSDQSTTHLVIENGSEFLRIVE